MAKRINIQLSVDIYERRDFDSLGPKGCNMCGGVISESLVQALLLEGIELPKEIVQRGLDSFKFYTEEETVSLHATAYEMRIATIYRGAGPLGDSESQWRSFDGYILEMAEASGANIIGDRVVDLQWQGDKPQVKTKGEQSKVYDLLVGAIGVNTPNLSLFEKLNFGYKPPQTRKTSNMEFKFGSDYIDANFGNCMHAFLVDLPKLDFSAVIPKANHTTLCLIGDDINSKFVDNFVRNPAVKRCLPDNISSSDAVCRCAPLASLGDATHPYGNRVVLLGDCAMTRLNKDGLGSAYRVAKAAAATALFRGISDDDFHQGYWPVCRTIRNDNRYGRLIYWVVSIIKKSRLLKRSVMRMASSEQLMPGGKRLMSSVLWDVFTGSSSYRDVLMRCLHPGFWSRLARNVIKSIFGAPMAAKKEEDNVPEEPMDKSTLGRHYKSGEIIVQRGEEGNCMYVVQSGEAEVIDYEDGKEIRIGLLKKGDVFGETAILRKVKRTATVRALTDMYIITIDKKIFLRRVHEDPSFVFVILQKLVGRIMELDNELLQIKYEIDPDN
ncbi:cyclic nucleotide-binding domain-containing protein [Chloroflexota bacterium]